MNTAALAEGKELGMRNTMLPIIAALAMTVWPACGGPSKGKAEVKTSPKTSPKASPKASSSTAPEAPKADTSDDEQPNEFQLRDVDNAEAHGVHPSKIEPTESEAAVRFFVKDKGNDEQPIAGIVISLEDHEGNTFYTEETDAEGYAEVLVPIGRSYKLTYLSLGRRDVKAKVDVPAEANLNLKLTLRYKRYTPPPAPEVAADAPEVPRFVLKGVEFDSGKASIKEESYARLDRVVEYMTYKKSARIEISGHTDNVGKPRDNMRLSEKRAQACRDYLVSKGVEASRIEAVGYGDTRPIASNDTAEGRQKNRRIEATEL